MKCGVSHQDTVMTSKPRCREYLRRTGLIDRVYSVSEVDKDTKSCRRDFQEPGDHSIPFSISTKPVCVRSVSTQLHSECGHGVYLCLNITGGKTPHFAVDHYTVDLYLCQRVVRHFSSDRDSPPLPPFTRVCLCLCERWTKSSSLTCTN